MRSVTFGIKCLAESSFWRHDRELQLEVIKQVQQIVHGLNVPGHGDDAVSDTVCECDSFDDEVDERRALERESRGRFMNWVEALKIGTVIIANDLIWWVPFGAILWLAWRQRQDACTPASPD